MKVCVFGAGAIGGYVAVRLLAARTDEISVVARGEMLKAMRRGVTLHSGGKEIKAKPETVTDDSSTLPAQDVVLVTTKAHALPGAAAAIARLIGPQGCAVFLLNGIPWWWNYGRSGGSGTLSLLDPESALWNLVKPERALGCVVSGPTDIPEPGVIVHTGAFKLTLGEPDGSLSPRLQAVSDMLNRGDIGTELSRDLRRDIWQKLVNNASGNTISALTRLDLKGLGDDPGLCDLAMKVMREALEVAASQGWDMREETDVEAAARRGKAGQRTSMMQDAVRGKPMEAEALLGQIQAFARENHVPVPTIDVILPLLRGLDRSFRKS